MIFAIVLALLQSAPQAPAPEVGSNLPAEFRRELDTLVWITYSPRPSDARQSSWESRADVREELGVLRQSGFAGLVTYRSSGIGQFIPAYAREVGFASIVAGVWDPKSAEELCAAEFIAKDVDAYCVGSGGLARLGGDAYDFEQLKRAIDQLAAATGKPVTTSEAIEAYAARPELAQVGDWLFPSARPFAAQKFGVDEAVEWTIGRYGELAQAASGRAIFLTEVSYPSGGEPRFNEDLQARFYAALRATEVRFVYFEAFDQPWRRHVPVGAHWGLFRADRTPKPAVEDLFGQTQLDVEQRLAFSSPRSGIKALVKLTAGGGQIRVSGTSRGVTDSGLRLVLFIDRQHPKSRGWILQTGAYGVTTWDEDGGWSGLGLLGGGGQRPTDNDPPISLAVLAVTEEVATGLIEQARGGRPMDLLPRVPAQRLALAEDVPLRMVHDW